MQFLIKIFVVIAISVVSSYFIQRFQASKSLTMMTIIIVSAIAAIAVFASDEAVNAVGKYLNAPKVVIETQKTLTEITINIKIKGSIDQLSLNYPIQGVITNFQDLNSINDAYTSTARVVEGSTENDIQNNFEISVINLKPNAQITYKVFYKVPPINIFIAGMDRYQYSYVWEYKGEKFYKDGWKLIADDSETTAPSVIIRGTRVFNRAMTPEEIKKLYETSSPKRNL